MNDPFLLVLACGIPAILVLIAVLGWVAYKGMVRIEIYDREWIETTRLESGEITAEQLERPWIRKEIASRFGYGIAVRALRGSGAGLAIFHHGVTLNWIGMLRYMEFFLRDGWTVVALDSRGHGDTRAGSLRPSYGCFEKHDLKAVADWALGEFPHEEGFVMVGESMGAAIALQYAPLDPRLDAVVADCSFTSAAAEMDYRLKRSHAPFFLRGAIVRVADFFCEIFDGFSLFDAAPDRAILETDVPILFVHGLEDDYVPWRMSVIMSESRKRRRPDAVTELRLVSEARHAKSINADPDAYAEAIRTFIAASLAARLAGESRASLHY